MKRNLSSLVFLLFFSFFSSYLNAAHIIGGEMTYKCLGDDQYEFTMKIYRDCFGFGADFDSSPLSGTQASITIYNGVSQTPFISAQANAQGSIYLDAPSVQHLDVVYPSQCLTSLPVCVEEGIYKFILTLPNSPESYYVIYQRCCRNNTISNIILPEETGATFFIELKPEAQFANGNCPNNSPEFADFPPLVLCTNEPINFNHSATDDDADELLYRFCSPLKGGGLAGTAGAPGLATDINGVAPNPDAPIPYNIVDWILPTYSGIAPLAGNPQVAIDEQTGIITGTPNLIGQFVVGICVDEYRTGVLLSTVQRDFQFNIKACTQPLVDSDFSFDLISNDVNFSNESVNAYTYEWDFGDQNTSTEESPSHSYSSVGTFTVTLNAYNDLCQLVDSKTKEVEIITTSIQNSQNDWNISVTPNPSNGKFQIEINYFVTTELQIELFDLTGKKVLDVFEQNISGNYVQSFDQSHLTHGIYFIKVSTEERVQVNKLMIQ